MTERDMQHYSGLGDLPMLEFAVDQNGENPPKYIPEEEAEGSSIPLIPITEAHLNGETPYPAEPYNGAENKRRLEKLGEAYKRRLQPGEIGIRAVWSEPNDPKGIAERRKEYVTVSHDIHRDLEVIIDPETNEPSFVFYKYEPVAYPGETWWGLKKNSEIPQVNGVKPAHIEASAKYHDQKTFLSFKRVPTAPADTLVMSATEFKRRVLDKGEDAFVDAQAISAVAKYLYAQEVDDEDGNTEFTSVLVNQSPYHPVSIPTQETNPWFDIDVINQTLPTDAFATQPIYVGERRELINPTTDEAITIQVRENNAATPDERYTIILQSELSPNHYLDQVLVAIGGGVEKDETPRDAAEREQGEETGQEGEMVHLGGKIHRSSILRSSTHVFVTLNPKNSDKEFVGDESERSKLHEYSISKVKRAIATGKITDAATISALAKTIVYLESLPPALPELDQHHENNRQAARKKMENIVLGLLERPEYKLLLQRLKNIPKEGLIRKGENGLPDFSEEGALYTTLMKDGSLHILRNSRNLTEYQTMLSEFLAMIEGNVANHLLNLAPEQQSQLRGIFAQIASDTIDLFEGVDFLDLLDGNYDQLQQKKNSARSNASKAGTRNAPKILKVFEPHLVLDQLDSRIKDLRNTTTVQDLFRIATNMLGYPNIKFPGVQSLYQYMALPKYTEYLPESDHPKIIDIINRSSEAQYLPELTPKDRETIAVLQGIHTSWASAQGLLDEKRLERDAYVPLPALMLLKFKQRLSESTLDLGNPNEQEIGDAIMVAVIELMKDLIYLEV